MPVPTNSTARQRLLAQAASKPLQNNEVIVTNPSDSFKADISGQSTNAVTIRNDAQAARQQSQFQRLNTPYGMEYVNGQLRIKDGYEADPVTGFVLPTTQKALENIDTEKYILPASILQGADEAATGLTSTLDFLIGRPLQALGWENNPISALNEKLQTEKQQNREYFAQKMEGDTSSQAISNVGTQVVAALPDALLAALTAGGSAAAQATTKGLEAASAASKAVSGNKIVQAANTAASTLRNMAKDPQAWFSFSRVLGPSFDEAEADGAGDIKSTAYATINALLNTIVEIGGGGIQTLPAEIRQGGSALRQWVDTMLDEGKEEVVQGIIERLAQNVVYGKGNPLFSVTDENAVFNPVTSAKEGGMGALVGGILGGGQLALSGAFNGSAVEPQTDAYRLFMEQAGLTQQAPAQAATEAQTAPQAGVQAETPVTQQTAAETPTAPQVDAPVVEQTAQQPQVDTPVIQQSVAQNEAGQVGDINAVGAAQTGFVPEGDAQATEAYQSAIDEYGAMPARENLARQIDVPKSTDGETVVPRTVQSALGSDITSSEAVGEITNTIAQHGLDRAVISDKAAQSRAQNTIAEKGWDAALRDWTAEVRSGKVSKDLTTLGLELYNNAVNSGHAKEAVDILTDLADSVRSGAQSTQVMHLLQKLTPQGQLYGIQRTVQNLQDELTARYKDKAPNLELNQEYLENFLTAETDAQRADALDAIYQDIANQMPARWIDKLNAWRYLSMLGNPRTHVRNILGNLFFAPVRAAKDTIAAGLESVFIRDQSQRTKSVASRLTNAEDRARYAAAKADYAEVADMISSGGKFQNDYNEIRSRQRIFKNGFLEAARVKNSELLDVEDVWFSKPAYASALTQYLKAQGITAEQYMSEGFDKSAAQAYAVKEAQKAVYRDYNAFSDFVSGLGKSKYKAVRGFVEGVLPFKRTPANILMRGIEYSPLGLAKGIYDAMVNIRSGKVTAAEAIDSISSGLTGTGLMALGAMLAAQGLLSGGGSGDEKQDAFNDLRGGQNYAITIGDRSYTLDWTAPEALPFFVGVEIYRALGDENLTFTDILNSLKKISDPMLEMSMLSGINDMLDSVSYAQSTNNIWPFLASAATSYLSQYVPTLLGQVERTFLEDTRQSTYTNPDSFLSTDVQYAISQAANKIPGIDYQQVDYIDAWGRKESTGSLAERAINNFLNPAYVSKDASTDVDDKLQAIYDATGGEYNVFPERVTMSAAVNGERFTDPEKYEEYATMLGQERLKAVEDFFNSPMSEAMTPAQQGEAIEQIYKYAKEITQNRLMGTELSTSSKNAQEFGDAAEYFAFYSAWQNAQNGDSAAFEAAADSYDSLSPAKQEQLGELIGGRFGDLMDMREAGVSTQKAFDVYEAISSLSPLPGKTQVSNQQRYDTIVNMSGWSEQEKLAALNEYEGSSSGEKMKFQTAYNYGVSPELYTEMLSLKGQGVGDENGNGSYSQDDTTALIEYMLVNYEDMDSREAAILWAMLSNTSKTGNPYGNIYGPSMQWATAD